MKAHEIITLVLLILLAGLLAVGVKGTCCETTPEGIYYATFWAMTWIGLSFWFAFRVSKGDSTLLVNLLLSGIVGGLMGWLLGVYFFPLNTNEAQTFQSLSTVIGSFVGGFLAKDASKILEYLTSEGPNKRPRILDASYRDCVLFFFASFMMSAGVQYTIRTFVNLQVTWEGTSPPPDKDSRYKILPGQSFWLGAAVSGGNSFGVRWRLESPLHPELVDNYRDLLRIDQQGKLTSEPEEKWKAQTDLQKVDCLEFEVVASSRARPALVNTKSIRVYTSPSVKDCAEPRGESEKGIPKAKDKPDPTASPVRKK